MTALRVAANRKASCVPEMEAELPDARILDLCVPTGLCSAPLPSSLEERASVITNGPMELRHLNILTGSAVTARIIQSEV